MGRVMLAAGIVAAAAVLLGGLRAWPLVRPARTIGSSSRPAHVLRLLHRGQARCRPVSDVAAAGWCDEAARTLRAGSTLTVAVAEATTRHRDMQPALAGVLGAVGRGWRLADALEAAPIDAG